MVVEVVVPSSSSSSKGTVVGRIKQLNAMHIQVRVPVLFCNVNSFISLVFLQCHAEAAVAPLPMGLITSASSYTSVIIINCVISYHIYRSL